MTSEKSYIPVSRLLDLTDKVAIVTGGAAGLGFSISYRLAESGAKVLIVDADGDEAQRAMRDLNSCGYQTDFVQCNVSIEKEVRAMAQSTIRQMGHIDILVNNAGIYPRVPLTEMTGKDFDEVVSVNLKGTFLCSREVSRHMIERRRGGCIINIASIDAVRPSGDGMTAYDASKGGVLALTKSMAREFGRHDIRVNVIAPGAILTKGVVSLLSGPATNNSRAQLKVFMTHMPLGRMGEADDIGRVALFLASDLASYMTGSVVVADGGYLVG